MLDFFAENFQGYIWLAVIIIAMIPSLEARIAIPFALSLNQINTQISPNLTLLCGFIGSILPCLPLLFFCKFLKKKSTGFMYDKFTNIIKTRYSKDSQNLKHSSKLKNMIKLSLFVAIPFPLTGVWSGSLIGGFSNLNVWESFLAIVFGALLSSLIILVVCLLFGNSVVYFLIISIVIVALYLITQFTINIIKKNHR